MTESTEESTPQLIATPPLFYQCAICKRKLDKPHEPCVIVKGDLRCQACQTEEQIKASRNRAQDKVRPQLPPVEESKDKA